MATIKTFTIDGQTFDALVINSESREIANLKLTAHKIMELNDEIFGRDLVNARISYIQETYSKTAKKMVSVDRPDRNELKTLFPNLFKNRARKPKVDGEPVNA